MKCGKKNNFILLYQCSSGRKNRQKTVFRSVHFLFDENPVLKSWFTQLYKFDVHSEHVPGKKKYNLWLSFTLSLNLLCEAASQGVTEKLQFHHSSLWTICGELQYILIQDMFINIV